MKIDERFKEWADERQIERIDACNNFDTVKLAAKHLGVSKTAIIQSIAIVKRKAAQHGFSPSHDMHRTVPDGFLVKGVSTYYNAEGKPSGQWVKSTADQDRRKQIIESAYKAMCDEIPRLEPFKPIPEQPDQLCTLYTMTDCHVGMLAWKKETGDDWDLKIAERVLTGCFEKMVLMSPPSHTAFISQLGDWLHFDGMTPVTPQHGHILDADSRYSKIVQTSIRILRRLISFALEKHNKVVVLMAEGNHDMASSIWLRVMFKHIYENEPRVEIIDSEIPYYVYQHGEVMLSFHHGHLRKNDQLPLLFASQFPTIWGSTTKRYCHTGHRHHVEEKEHSGMTVIQHPTLAARDAYAARGGWISERKVSSITYHRVYGQVGKITVVPEMLE